MIAAWDLQIEAKFDLRALPGWTRRCHVFVRLQTRRRLCRVWRLAPSRARSLLRRASFWKGCNDVPADDHALVVPAKPGLAITQ